jgi:hypothetical protein
VLDEFAHLHEICVESEGLHEAGVDLGAHRVAGNLWDADEIDVPHLIVERTAGGRILEEDRL